MIRQDCTTLTRIDLLLLACKKYYIGLNKSFLVFNYGDNENVRVREDNIFL